MHPQSPLLTIDGTVLKESDDLVILRVTFVSKMTFEMHLRSVSITASQRLGILRKSCRVFHDRSLLGRCFRGFVLPVLEYCPAVLCSAADTHIKLLDRAVSGARFLTGGVFECDISHRRSVAVLCMLYTIRCNPVRPLNCDIPGPYVPVRVTCSALVAHRYTLIHCLAAEPCSTAGLIFPSRCPSGTILLTEYSMVWDWPVSRIGALKNWPVWDWRPLFHFSGQYFFIGLRCSITSIIFYSFSFLFFLPIGWYCGAGVFGLIGCISLSLSLALPIFLNNNNINLL